MSLIPPLISRAGRQRESNPRYSLSFSPSHSTITPHANKQDLPRSTQWAIVFIMRRPLVLFFIALVIGALIGAALGWLRPIHDVSVGIDKLHPDYKADYVVMVGAAYASNSDWDLAQARLGRLAEPDPAAYVVGVAERYIQEGRSPADIRNLVGLAARLGYTTPPMQPYLSPAQP
jgi:hypothetical protein